MSLRLIPGNRLPYMCFRTSQCLIHRRNLSVTMHWRNSESKTPKGQTINNNKADQQAEESDDLKAAAKGEEVPSESKSPVSELLEGVTPYLDKAHHYYKTTSEQVNNVIVPIKHHYGKAKEAIREANERLEQQEKESQSYAFNEDLSAQATNKTIQGLPSDREKHRKLWAKKLELYIDSLQETIFTATRALNDVTGYSSIQKLRESIDILEADLEKAKENAREQRLLHNEAVAKRLETQREVNALLQRQASWSPEDVEKFTRLYKEDHDNGTLEEETKVKMEKAEAHEEELQEKLSNAILTRYHEEQIWSDKIRRTSTWGTFGLMGINILLFLVFQLALEPWKRRRLVGNFEEKVRSALEENSLKQNERLDMMSEKVEALKHSDRLPPIEARLESEIFDNDSHTIEPPVIRELPLPVPQPSLTGRLLRSLAKICDPLRSPFRLIFYKHYEEIPINKSEIISATSVSLTIGIFIGYIFTSMYK